MPAFVTAVECWVLRAPIAAPVATAFGAMSNRPALFVRVWAADGAFGWGEVFSNFPQIGAEHRARLIDSIFEPLLMGSSTDDPETIRTMLDARTRPMKIQCGEPGPFAQVIGGIDQALWDLGARRAGVPLWRHLGGTDPRVRVYASGIGPNDVVETALAKRSEGFRAFKLKVGFDAKRDRENLASIRRALGESATIMTDANQAWAPDEAVEHIEALASYRPHWIEEPMLADQPLAAWQRLAQKLVVPIAAGENIRGASDFRAAIDASYLSFVQPDVGKWGGISGCRDVARHAVQRGVTFCPHWLAGGVGLAASLHLTAAVGTSKSYCEVDANPNPLREEICPLRVIEGVVTLSDAPGIGIEPDLERLSRYIVKH
ncbi:MAG TPA: mandelate racemase/muconate lactonizing enzyme family protein [Casimicrobiaceae bacterium]|nr:mandelate racemase/muconate lactonizing enzyme family protein [Casimicrobiaceae bacterium]